MIPLVAYEGELELTRARVLAVAEEEGFTYGRDFGVGTMIELPRACFIADRIARHADFFSFGTNDLTQTAIGFSRDDVEGRIIPRYVAERILDISPFASIDEAGVGELVQTAVRRGRRGRANIELGICGEHGGDPDSIASSTARASITSAARPSASRSREWPPPRRRSALLDQPQAAPGRRHDARSETG
jgi:pyruvate,orthophosphate dikinase